MSGCHLGVSFTTSNQISINFVHRFVSISVTFYLLLKQEEEQIGAKMLTVLVRKTKSFPEAYLHFRTTSYVHTQKPGK